MTNKFTNRHGEERTYAAKAVREFMRPDTGRICYTSSVRFEGGGRALSTTLTCAVSLGVAA